MATRLEMMQEANRRGILQGRSLEMYQEAVRRGLIPAESGGAGQAEPVQQAAPAQVVSSTPSGNRLFTTAQEMAGAASQPMIAPEVFQGAIRNLPESTVNLVGDTLGFFQQMATSGDAREAVYKSVRGLVERAIPGEQDYEQYAQPIIDDLVKSYGSVEAAQATLRDDPARFLADAAGLMSGAGAAVRGVGAAGKIGRLAEAGRALSKAGAAIDPVNLAASAALAPASLVPAALPRKLYGAAIKPSTTAFRPEERAKIIETAMQNRLTPDQPGIDRLYAKINAVNERVNEKINQLEASGKTVDAQRVQDSVYSLLGEIQNYPNPETQLAALEKIEREFSALGPGPLTPRQAQKMKQNIYSELDYDKGLGRAPDSMTEKARKAQARALREGIEDISPEMRGMNRELGEYLALRPIFEQGANRIANRSIFGDIGLALAVGAGATAGSPTLGAIAGLGRLAASDPWLAPRVALALEYGRTMAPGGARVPGLTLRQLGAQGDRLTNSTYGR